MAADLEHIPSHAAQRPRTLQGRIAKVLRGTAKGLLPQATIEELRRYRALSKNERVIYVKARVLNGIGLAEQKRLSSPETVRSIIFVCFGNIMRSPMCEALLRRGLSEASQLQISILSAGLNATPGRPAHPWAIIAAEEFGISLEGHRARLLSGEMVDSADVIFAMDYQNQAQLVSRWPGSIKKVHMLSAYGDRTCRLAEIADPYYASQEETKRCYRTIATCVQNLADSLLKTRS